MVLVGGLKLELYLFCFVSLLAYSVGLRANALDELHNQLNDNQQQKRANGFVPMRGRKNDEDFTAGSADRSADNEKENGLTAEGNNLELIKTLNNLLKLNNGNLEEQLTLLDQSYGTSQPVSQSVNVAHRAYEAPRFHPAMFNQRAYSEQVTPFLGIMTRYGSPKRAGFVPMRGRKSDPNMPVGNYQDDFIAYAPLKRAGFLPMRGKKSSMELDDLENQFNQFNQKRAFHALRG